MSDNKMAEMIRASIEGIKSSFDANTVTGTPIETANGTVIIPVSKLSVGFASGGLDYMGKNALQKDSAPKNFGGGGGTGASVTPIAFIVITPDGKVDMLNIAEKAEPADTVSQVIGAIERSPELIEKVRDIFKKKGQ